MVKTGRPRKTREEKMMIGTYRKDRDIVYNVSGDAIEQVPDIKFDDPIQQEYFDRTCQTLIDNGWLLKDFIDDIKRAAEWYGLYREHKTKPMTQCSANGFITMTASYTIRRDAHKFLCEFEQRYGLNLLASQRFSKKDKKDEDPFHKLLNAK